MPNIPISYDHNNRDWTGNLTGLQLLETEMDKAGIPNGSQTVWVKSIADFPEPVNSVITLVDNVTYYVVTDVDLQGNRIVGGANSCIIGHSSENSFLRSSLPEGQYLIQTAYTMPIRHISLDAGNGWAFHGNNGGSNAYDWYGVNVYGKDGLKIGDVSNFVSQSMAFFNTGIGIQMYGEVGTFGVRDIFFSGSNSLALQVLSTTTVLRRIRFESSTVIVNGTNQGFNVSSDATIPVEGYILTKINFNGTAPQVNKLIGVQPDEDKALFSGCSGIPNSATIANLYMKNNLTATVVTTQGERYKILGTSEISDIIQRFSHNTVDNALTYQSSVSRIVKATMSISLTSGSNNIIGVYLGVKRNGNTINPTNDRISESEVYITTSGSRPDAGTIQCLVRLNQGDEIYGIVQNTNATTDITVNFMNLIVEATSN